MSVSEEVVLLVNGKKIEVTDWTIEIEQLDDGVTSDGWKKYREGDRKYILYSKKA